MVIVPVPGNDVESLQPTKQVPRCAAVHLPIPNVAQAFPRDDSVEYSQFPRSQFSLSRVGLFFLGFCPLGGLVCCAFCVNLQTHAVPITLGLQRSEVCCTTGTGGGQNGSRDAGLT